MVRRKPQKNNLNLAVEIRKAEEIVEELHERFNLIPRLGEKEDLFFVVPRARWVIEKRGLNGDGILLVRYGRSARGEFSKEMKKIAQYTSQQEYLVREFFSKNENIKLGFADDDKIFHFLNEPTNYLCIGGHGPDIHLPPDTFLGSNRIEEEMRKFYQTAIYFCPFPRQDPITKGVIKRLGEILGEENNFVVLPPVQLHQTLDNNRYPELEGRILSESQMNWYASVE